jgi:hypothetical protein
VLKNVKDPIFVKELIHKQVEDVKIKRRVRFGEIMTDADGDGDMDDLDDLNHQAMLPAANRGREFLR